MPEHLNRPAVPETRVPAESWSRYFWKLQRDLGNRYIAPLLRKWGIELSGTGVLDLGCGEGGVAASFAEAGADVTAVDISAERIEAGKRLTEGEWETPTSPAGSGGLNLVQGDIFDRRLGSRLESDADLVLLLDVIEHVDNPVELLRGIRRLLSPGGLILVSFPPFYSPFGLHQQLLRSSPLRRIPWIQLFPWRVYSRWVRGPWADDIKGVRGTSISLKKFESITAEAGFRIARSRSFLVRPIHHLKFGVPVIGAGIAGRLPLLRELVVSGAFFLIAPVNEAEPADRIPDGTQAPFESRSIP